jgi:hypothetical protein
VCRERVGKGGWEAYVSVRRSPSLSKDGENFRRIKKDMKGIGEEEGKKSVRLSSTSSHISPLCLWPIVRTLTNVSAWEEEGGTRLD